MDTFVWVLRLAGPAFILAGASRLLAIWLTGWPSSLVLVLTAIELVGPLLLLAWLRKLGPLALPEPQP
jgi:hypothetical protein